MLHSILLMFLPDHSPLLPRGKITLYCIADAFDRHELEQILKLEYTSSSVRSYPDCFYVDFVRSMDEEPGSGV